MNKEALHVHATHIAQGLTKAKVFYEDRGVQDRDDIEVFVDGDTVKVNLVLDDENLGKVTRIQLLNDDDVIMKDRPFVLEVTSEYNVYVSFRYRVVEREVTKEKYIGGEVKYE